MIRVDTPATYMFIVFIILFTLFYFFFIDRDVSRNFFLLTIVCIFSYIHIKSIKQKQKDNANIITFIDSLEKRMVKSDAILLKNVYMIHKVPKTLKYIRMHDVFMTLIYDMRYLEKYDKSNYFYIVYLCEYFLKLHYNIILEKYDIHTFYSIIVDVRKEILNIIHSTVFNVPRYSSIVSNINMETFIQQMRFKMQYLTQRYLNIIHAKYTFLKKPDEPIAFDIHSNSLYDIY